MYLSFCGQFSHLHLQRFVNVQCRHLRFLLISSVSLLLSVIGKLLLHFQSHSLVFGSIHFHLLTHSLPIWMGILPSWIHHFHQRIFDVSWSDSPVFPLVIFDLAFVWVASTMIELHFITSFSMAISTVLLINISNRFTSFNRNLRNLVNELGSITDSSGAMSRKNLNDISYLERSTISTSDKSKMVLRSKYLNIRIGSIAFRPFV